MYLSKREFEKKMALAKRKNASKLRKQLLRQEKMKNWPKIKLPSTSKLVLLVAALLCIEILIFCQYMILVTGDTNTLYAMVGALASFVPIVLGYYMKSMKQNTVGGITYETAMADKMIQNQSNLNTNDEEAVG